MTHDAPPRGAGGPNPTGMALQRQQDRDRRVFGVPTGVTTGVTKGVTTGSMQGLTALLSNLLGELSM